MGFATDVWQLLVLRLLQGVFSGFAAPSITLVSVAAPPAEQGRVTGSLQTAMAAGAVIGPMVGSLVGATLGLQWVFLSVAFAAIGSSVLVAFWTSEDVAHRRVVDEERSFIQAVRGSGRDIAELWRSDTLRASLWIVFLIQLGLGATNPILDLYVRGFVPPDPELAKYATGALFSGFAVVNLLAMPVWGRHGDKKGHALALVECALWSGAALVSHAVVRNFVFLFTARLMLGAATAGSAPCAFGLAASEASVDRRGGAFGVVFSARTLAVAISAMLGGYLSRFVGIRGLFAISGVVVLWSAWAMRRAAQRRASARSVAGG
jgi:MFS transporter, DHA1 family, multidrug resistance protein